VEEEHHLLVSEDDILKKLREVQYHQFCDLTYLIRKVQESRRGGECAYIEHQEHEIIRVVSWKSNR
jgi:hypothetical protein